VSVAEVLRRIESDCVVELALELASIDSPTTSEQAAAARLYDWLDEQGFAPRDVSLVPEHPNLIGVLRGSGGGRSLLFNSHMDTSVWHGHPAMRDPDDPMWHTAWEEDGVLYGFGLMNDKGPMAAWLIAALAVKEAGVRLRGDVVLTMVSGEIGHEPVDEFRGPDFSGKDLGARYLAVHGGIADYVLVAENTGFCLGWVEAGKLFCKVRVFGAPSWYTPYVPLQDARTAIDAAATFLAAWEAWSREYTLRHRVELPGGIVEPRAAIGAMRSGLPYAVTHTPELCDFYLDLRLAPGQSPTETAEEVRALVAGLGLEATVEPYLYRPGHEANGVEPLAEAVRGAHADVLGDDRGLPWTAYTSMWRDSNVWNELGIPAAMYGPDAVLGPQRFGISVDSLHKVAQVYAATALRLCA
jgi:acetylornithine deacetylase/succinyl-diaminopimelate desuccinylase-like protein